MPRIQIEWDRGLFAVVVLIASLQAACRSGYIRKMAIPFERLGLWFKLFSVLFYPREAKQHAFAFIQHAEPSGFVVDLGGGAGTLLNLTHKIRTDLTYLCVDPAIGMLKYVPPYAQRVAALSEDLPFGDNTVVAVMIGDAIHHFTDPERGIKEVHRILKPGGRLFIFDINPKTRTGRIAVGMERRLREPANFYSPEHLEDRSIKMGIPSWSRATARAILLKPRSTLRALLIDDYLLRHAVA
jgi:SAM-dependent methyltransferase